MKCTSSLCHTRTFVKRPCSYIYCYSSKIRSSPSGRVYKGKSAIYITREVQGRTHNFFGQNFWARGYFVSTVGRDEKVVRDYISRQEQEDQRLEQLKLVTYSHLQAAPILSRFERFTDKPRLCREYLTFSYAL